MARGVLESPSAPAPLPLTGRGKPGKTTLVTAEPLRRRREGMTAHDVGHLDSVRRRPCGRVDHLGTLRKNCGPIAAGVTAQRAFTSWLPALSNR
jgi:hypothetical protein